MKHTKRRTLRSLVTIVGCLLLTLQLAGCGSDDNDTTVVAEEVSTPAPEPYLSTGFPNVIVVSGTDYEMGLQYGRQAAAAILHNTTIFKSKLYDQLGQEVLTNDMKVWDYYLRRFDPTLSDWIQGISDGCAEKGSYVSYLDLVLLMVYPTELWSRPFAPYPEETGVTETALPRVAEEFVIPSYHSCNTFAATGSATPDGNPVHGITSMQGEEMMDTIILIAFPDVGASFVAPTYAGRVNANAAMNSNGLAWTMTAIMADSPAWGLTEVYFHWLAQHGDTITNAVDYIESTTVGGVAGGFTFSDASGDVKVLETIGMVPQLDPTTFGAPEMYSNLRSPGDMGENGPWVVQTNFLNPEWMEPYNPFWLDFIGTFARHDTVFQFLTEAEPGTIDVDFAKAMFASDDWYDATEGVWHYNEPGAPGISNDHTSVAQSIFLPADLIAYIQPGTPSGIGIPSFATGEYVKIHLDTDPKPVTIDADADALAYYWEARDMFEQAFNADALAGYLVEEVADKLDEAMVAYSQGIDREAFAILSTDPDEQLELWSAALTYFAKAQLYAQMAKTTLLNAEM